MSRDELKAQLIGTFLAGVEAKWVCQKAEDFASWFGPSSCAHQGKISRGRNCVRSGGYTLLGFSGASSAALRRTSRHQAHRYRTGSGRWSLDRQDQRKQLSLREQGTPIEAIYGPLTQYRLRAWGYPWRSNYWMQRKMRIGVIFTPRGGVPARGIARPGAR